MRYGIALFMLMLLGSSAVAITPEELARLSEKGAAEKRMLDSQLKLKDLHYDVKREQADKAAASPAADKPDKGNRGSATVKQKPKTVNTQHSPSLPQARKYTSRASLSQSQTTDQSSRSTHASAPSRRLATAPTQTIYTDAVTPDNSRYYGIRRGAWLRAELRRNINNAEPGDVELYITHDVHGSKNTLPAQTQLFAAKALNNATRRLDMLTSYAVTPSGREFTLKARIYDSLKVSGLTGIIDADTDKIAQRGAAKGLAALGSSILDEVGSQNIVGRGLARGGQSVIQDSQRAAEIDTQQQITIFVAPQPVLLRVEQTF